ncbi:RCC1 domain-containing protein [Actinoplanes sp. NPDC049265]|uniref:RCC1 domain-containing protein n=1 Tax=Actinoplanes sp. NPDC049265 TaxID=3363902 RepID=UPI00371B49C8
MITSTRRWRILAAATIALLVPAAAAAPAHSAPADDPPLVKALKAQAELFKQRRITSSLQDGYPGGLSIAAGGTMSCSTATPTLWCWGAGDPDPATPATPIEVAGTVAAGRAHQCVLQWFDESDEGGDLYCWGDNTYGQVGDGTTTDRPAPVKVLDHVLQVAAGADHTCAVLDDQTLNCWGRNDSGQLGQGSVGVPVTSPQAVPGLTDDVIDLAAGGDTTCVIDENLVAGCWGSNSDGQIGDGNVSATPVPTPTPVDVSGVPNADLTQITVGARHTCATTERGKAICWGSDAHGQLGDGTPLTDHPLPVVVPGLSDLYLISAGGDSNCAIDQDGVATCWGDNGGGQLGVGDRVDRPAPAAVDMTKVLGSPILADLIGVDEGMLAEISIGAGHACAIDTGGNVYCWGANADGQLGDGTTTDHLVPAPTRLLPGLATGVQAQARDAEIGVDWDAPADLGAGTFDTYGVIAVAEKEFEQCVSDETGCTITNLVNDQEYAIFVATVTSAGAAISPAVRATPHGQPSPAPVAGGGGGQLPITGAAISLLLAIGGAMIIGGWLIRRRAS